MTPRRWLYARTAAVTLLALGLAFAAGLAIFQRSERRRFDDALVSVATRIAENAERAEIVAGAGGLRIAEESGLYGAVYDEQGSPETATSSFANAAPLSGVLHPSGEPFDLARGPLLLRAVMVPLPRRPGAYLLLAMARTDLDAHTDLFARAWILAASLTTAWAVACALAVARRLGREHAGAVEALARELARVRGELETQKRFVAYAAHELRAPLTLVHGQLALALRRPRREHEYRDAIGEALDAASHLRTLTEDLLDLEKARGQVPGELEPVAVGRPARLAARHVHAAAQGRLVALDIKTPPLFVLGRPQDLERLLRNLLENAVRHSPPGGRVIVEARERDGRVEISVNDDGSGVAEGDRARVFEPFFRGQTTPEGHGAGLGLAIAREIARAHGGDLRLDPTAERGARFVFDLTALAPSGRVDKPALERETPVAP